MEQVKSTEEVKQTDHLRKVVHQIPQEFTDPVPGGYHRYNDE